MKRQLIKKIFVFLFVMMQTQASPQKYVFYLHGMIVEIQGADAVSPYYGAYRYNDILDTFRKAGFVVMSEVRKPDTDVRQYAKVIAGQISDLLKKGVPAHNITVIGASKGAVIAMHVSALLKNESLNFVFLAACNDGNFNAYPEIRFCGNILSVFELSDDIGESCSRFREKSAGSIQHYKELEINTGLQHGFLFRPIPEWTRPAIQWANGLYE